MTRRTVCWSLLALLLLPCLLTSAPAPKADRKAKPLTMLGDWTEGWGGTDYAAWFRDDATCGAVSGDSRWRGTWTLRGRRLYVTEQAGESWLTWDVELSETLSGTAVIRAAGSDDLVGRRVAVKFTKR